MPDSFDLFAAELAFGLLDGSERCEAEMLRATDPVFAAGVARWEAIAESWLGHLPDHAPSPELWDRVSALIAPSHGSAGGAGGAAGSAPGLGWWRPLAIAASLLACLFAGLWLSRPGGSAVPRAPGAARQDSGAASQNPGTASQNAGAGGRFSIAQLGGAGDPHLAAVLYDRDAGTLVIRIAAIAPVPDKAPELWLIDGTNPPRSLGFGQAGAATRMQASARWQRSLVGGATLAITLEPVSSHPHAAPSSKILGTGIISTL